jgi:hypothetical protein
MEIIQFLRTDAAWSVGVAPDRAREALNWVIFDGKNLLLRNSADPFLDEIRSGGQRSFAFFFNINATAREVKNNIDADRYDNFTLEVMPLMPIKLSS